MQFWYIRIFIRYTWKISNIFGHSYIFEHSFDKFMRSEYIRVYIRQLGLLLNIFGYSFIYHDSCQIYSDIHSIKKKNIRYAPGHTQTDAGAFFNRLLKLRERKNHFSMNFDPNYYIEKNKICRSYVSIEISFPFLII